MNKLYVCKVRNLLILYVLAYQLEYYQVSSPYGCNSIYEQRQWLKSIKELI